MGPFLAGKRQDKPKSTSTGLHLLIVHGIHDARIIALLCHRLTVAFLFFKIIPDASRKVEQYGLRGERSSVGNQCQIRQRTHSILGVLRIRSVCGHVLPGPGNASWIINSK
jgi:hypothetical protein